MKRQGLSDVLDAIYVFEEHLLQPVVINISNTRHIGNTMQEKPVLLIKMKTDL